MVKENLKEQVIDSIEVEDYLNEFINDSENNLQAKIEMSSFLSDYIDKGLFVVTVIKDGAVYLRVENEDDEVVSKELFIGNVVEDNLKDYELQAGTDHTITYYIESTLFDESINAEDKIFMIKDLIKYINRGYYRMDAVDKQGNMLQLILDQKNDVIIDKIYY